MTVTKKTVTKETSRDPLSHLCTFLWHAHHCACAHTYSSSHTRIHITYYTPYTLHITHYTLHTTHTTPCPSHIPIRITHGTPVGQCIARRTHKPIPKKLLLIGTPSVIGQLDPTPFVLSYLGLSIIVGVYGGAYIDIDMLFFLSMCSDELYSRNFMCYPSVIFVFLKLY